MREIALLDNYGYISVGISKRFDPLIDMYFMKLNQNGDTIFSRYFGGNKMDDGFSLVLSNDNSYILAGGTDSFDPNNNSQSYILKIDTNGNLLWQIAFSGLGREYAKSIRNYGTSKIVIAGTSDSLGNNVYRGKIRILDLNGGMVYENSMSRSNQLHKNKFNRILLR